MRGKIHGGWERDLRLGRRTQDRIRNRALREAKAIGCRVSERRARAKKATHETKRMQRRQEREKWQSTYLDRAAKRQNRGRMLFGLGGKEG